MAKRRSKAGAPAPAPEVPEGPPSEWVATFRSDPKARVRWNKLKADERRAIDLSDADLSGLDLHKLALRGASAKGAKFNGADLAGAELGEATLDGADFTGADLREAGLKKAHAAGASFRDARLAGSILAGGFFFQATFAGADLGGANLAGANLNKADLSGVNLDGADLEGATFDAKTTWPEGFAIPAGVLFAGRGTDPRLTRGEGGETVAVNLAGFVARLRACFDAKRMQRTIDMLKSSRNQLYSEVEPNLVRGVVRSQTEEGKLYACVLTDEGVYACHTPDLVPCLGMRKEPCKHLLTLLLGLARAGRLDPAVVDRWVVAAKSKKPCWEDAAKDHVVHTLLLYKGAEAGEVDWRPTETIPEDFYSL